MLNYARAVELRKRGGLVTGVMARDQETGEEFEPDARVVINAAGIFSDEIRALDDPAEAPMMALSQGTHLVLDRSFLPGESAILVPKTIDGRVLFAVPWHGRTIVGTTDIAVEAASAEPRPREEEVDFLLEHAAMYLARDPRHSDVRSLYSGIRPLVRASGDKGTFVGEVAWAARREMARTVEDVLARRTRALLLDARASMEAAPQTAAILAAELGRNEGWCRDQVEAYRTLAAGYVLG